MTGHPHLRLVVDNPPDRVNLVRKLWLLDTWQLRLVDEWLDGHCSQPDEA